MCLGSRLMPSATSKVVGLTVDDAVVAGIVSLRGEVSALAEKSRQSAARPRHNSLCANMILSMLIEVVFYLVAQTGTLAEAKAYPVQCLPAHEIMPVSIVERSVLRCPLPACG